MSARGQHTPSAVDRHQASHTTPTPSWLQLQQTLGESPTTEDEAFANLLAVFEDVTFLPFEGARNDDPR